MARRGYGQPLVPSLFSPTPADRGDVARSSSARGDRFKVMPFMEGVDRSLPGNMISDGAARRINNLWFPRESVFLTTRPSLQPILAAPLDGAVQSIHTYMNPVDNKVYVVFANIDINDTDQELHFVEAGQTTVNNLETDAGDREQAMVGSIIGPSFLTYNGKLVVGAAGKKLRIWGGNLTADSVYEFDAADDVVVGADTIDIGVDILVIGEKVRFETVSVGASLPAGISAGTDYYVQDKGVGGITRFTATFGGSLLDITADGSGTCRLVRLTSKSQAKVTVAGNPTADKVLVVGSSTFTFKNSRVNPFEITIAPGDATGQAHNIAAAINSDSYEVTASHTSAVVYMESNTTGGNPALSTNDANITIDLGFVGGRSGQVLDEVATYEAPADSATILSDKNQRLVAAGPSSPRVFFSAPGNEFSFASGVYGYGEYWDLGTKEGNEITSIISFFGELWAHKYGENSEIHRMQIVDPLPASWDLRPKFFDDTVAAISVKGAAAASSKQMVLGKRHISVFQGTDAYDEVRPVLEGAKVADLYGVANSNAFIVKDPDNLVLYVFPTQGKSCFVYHYGSGRWTTWSFPFDIYCGVFCEALGTTLFGAGDGNIYKLDASLATDSDGSATYPVVSSIVGKTLETEDLAKQYLKQVQLDLTNRKVGTGWFGVLYDRGESGAKKLFEFSLESVGYTLDELDALGTIDAVTSALGELYLTDESVYKKVSSNVPAEGALLAPYLEFTGAADVNKMTLRFSEEGRNL